MSRLLGERVWLDVNTPKQVRFFNELAKRLEAKGFKLLITARRFREVEQLARLIGLSYTPIGAYGGPSLEEKLRASLARSLRLFKVVKEWRPGLAISFSSPEAARVAYGLGIPHISVNDSPHSEAVARLTIPLSAKLFTPRCIPVEKWLRFGISRGDVVQYDAVDPAAWLKGRAELKAERDRLVVVRAAETHAYYVSSRERAGIVIDVAERLLNDIPRLKLIVLARYREQLAWLKERFQGRAVIPRRVVDSVEVVSKACLFIGGGGTMTWEAALLGTPTISCTPVEEVDVEDYLASLGLLQRARSVEEVLDIALDVLSNPKQWVREQCRRARQALESMENPVDVIASFIEKGWV